MDLGTTSGHPDAKQDLFLGPGAQHGFELAADLEHLLGIGQGLAAAFGQFQLATDALEQFQVPGLLEQADLAADGLGRQVQLFAGAGDTSGLSYSPEVMKLAVVEHGVSRFVKTEV